MTIEQKIISIAVPKHEILYDLESVVRLKDAIAIIKEACYKQRIICLDRVKVSVTHTLVPDSIMDVPYPEFEEDSND